MERLYQGSQTVVGVLNYSETQNGLQFHGCQTSAHGYGGSALKEHCGDPEQWSVHCSTKSCLAYYSDFKPIANSEPVGFESLKDPFTAAKEFRNKGLFFSINKARPLESCSKDRNSNYATEYLQNGDVGFLRASLKACAKTKELFEGIRIHNQLRRIGLVEKCSDALITMYARCDDLTKAKELLDAHKSRNVSSWTALIEGYARKGQSRDALICYECMRQEGLSPNARTFCCILKVCGSLKATEKGKQIHDEIVRQGLFQDNVFLGTSLIDMYAKCGALEKARCVLQEMSCRNAISWSALITGYAQSGLAEQALACYQSMQQEGLSPDAMTFASVLKACGVQGALVSGEQIHDEISKQGLLDSDFILGTALVDMYAKCGALTKAEQVLEELSCKDVGTWNALIAGYIQHGQVRKALQAYERIQVDGLIPDTVSLALALKACGISGTSGKGEQLEVEIRRQGLLSSSINNVLGPFVMDMYIQFGDFLKAERVKEELASQNILSWNLLISGYSQNGQGSEALRCYESMLSKGVLPDAITFTCALKACGIVKALEMGKEIHRKIASQGLSQRNIVVGNALVDFYAKCGALSDAHQVFDELSSKDIVTWSTLIAGYSEEGQGEEALKCFEDMQRAGICPNAVTYACILKACAVMGAVEKGKEFHKKIADAGLLGTEVVLDNALVDMYVKCGALEEAKELLKKLSFCDVSSWNLIIAGYAQQGQNEQVLNCLEQMENEGCPPNTVTFSCLLNACSHSGLIEDCHTYFGIMSTKFGVNPDVEHFTCMVDLFGRVGHLEKAIEVIQEMPSLDCAAVWRVLLAACKEWGNANVGKWAFEQVVRLEKSNAAAYTLMANMHARG